MPATSEVIYLEALGFKIRTSNFKKSDELNLSKTAMGFFLNQKSK